MKLFKSLLVAPAALGLLAPMTVTANELNFTDVSDYSSSKEVKSISEFYPEQLAITAGRVDGLEARMNNYEAGSFSETTTASFSADMYLGSFDDDDSTDDDAVNAGYSFQIDLNTSFTGEDSLDISLDAGSAPEGIAEFDGNGGGDGLTVDGVSYTFPLGDKTTVITGIDTDGSALFTAACVYGGPSNTLDDCGSNYAGITGGGATIGVAYDFGTGFTAAFGAQTEEGSVFTEESSDAYAFNAAYTGDNYGISLTFAEIEEVTTGAEDATIWALQGYYTPDAEGLPSVSVGYETASTAIDSLSSSDTDSSAWFLGLSWDEVGPGTAGVAVGTKQHTLDVSGEAYDEMLMYEAYYSYDINDGMSVTPLIFIKDNAVSGTDDETGVMVKTSFSF